MKLELPEGCLSWYHFWKDIENQGLANKTIVFVMEIDGQTRTGYNLAKVKEMLLAELLDQADKMQGFTIEELTEIDFALERQGVDSFKRGNELRRKVNDNIELLYKKA